MGGRVLIPYGTRWGDFMKLFFKGRSSVEEKAEAVVRAAEVLRVARLRAAGHHADVRGQAPQAHVASGVSAATLDAAAAAWLLWQSAAAEAALMQGLAENAPAAFDAPAPAGFGPVEAGGAAADAWSSADVAQVPPFDFDWSGLGPMWGEADIETDGDFGDLALVFSAGPHHAV